MDGQHLYEFVYREAAGAKCPDKKLALDKNLISYLPTIG
jgi:hypothetical protein